jgi:hypothetical protein
MCDGVARGLRADSAQVPCHHLFPTCSLKISDALVSRNAKKLPGTLYVTKQHVCWAATLPNSRKAHEDRLNLALNYEKIVRLDNVGRLVPKRCPFILMPLNCSSRKLVNNQPPMTSVTILKASSCDSDPYRIAGDENPKFCDFSSFFFEFLTKTKSRGFGSS